MGIISLLQTVHSYGAQEAEIISDDFYGRK